MPRVDRRTAALVLALLGALCWVARWIADPTGTAADAMEYGGLVLLGLALVLMGSSLVSRSAVWLQLIVAVAFPLLVWSVVSVLHDSFDDVAVDAVAGVVVLLLAGVMRGRRSQKAPARPRSGSHAR